MTPPAIPDDGEFDAEFVRLMEAEFTTPGASQPGSGGADPQSAEEIVLDAEPASDPVDSGLVDAELLDADSVAPGPVDGGSADAGLAADSEVHPDTALAAERLGDLQRLQAEYVNYKRRVDRDRVTIADSAVAGVLESFLPVLDEIHLAREHGDLSEGPFKSMADKLEGIVGKYGLERFGSVGEAFDPNQHEALMHAPWDAENPDLPSDAETTTVVTLLQPGYRLGARVLRPARVAVADPA